MEFRILGPLEVRDDGRVLALGGARDRRILAALLLDANRVVPLPRLVEAAWDGPPPATAERQVRNRVAALRAQLTAAGAHIDTEDHIALEAAGRLADQDWQARSHRTLGRAYSQVDRFDDGERHYRAALDRYERLGDRAGQAHTYLSMSWMVEMRSHDPEESIGYTRRALDLYTAVGHRLGEARAVSFLAWDLALLGDYQQSIAYSERALVLHRELNDEYGTASTWDSIGYAHYHLGDHARADECFHRSLAIYRQAGDRYNETEVLDHLGDNHRATGDVPAALDAWRAAVAILDELGHSGAAEIRAKIESVG